MQCVFFSLLNRSRLRQWLIKLKEKRSRSSALSKFYRQEGNQFFLEATNPHDLAADYFTKAIFAAPKGSIELALAHANRAACALHMAQLEVIDFFLFKNQTT